MKSKVFFKEIKSRDLGALKKGLKSLLNESGFFSRLRKKEIVPIKLTFGEKDNKGFPNPQLMKVVVDKIKAYSAKPYLTDSNVLYHGERTNAVDHMNLAYEHGFLPNVCGAPVVIADGVFSSAVREVKISGRHLSSIKIPPDLLNTDSIIGVAHFTGHMLTGFGGAVKNIGMGLASRAGKQIQHSVVKPSILEKKCVMCGKCIEVCPVKAISERNRKAHIDDSICIGCADCVAACRFEAVDIKWNVDVSGMEERMVEYAWGILQMIKNRYFINILIMITPECDCLEEGTKGIVEDIGMLASEDCTALDKASLDLVHERSGKDVFKEAHPKADYERQLSYAVEMGLGSLDYELITVK